MDYSGLAFDQIHVLRLTGVTGRASLSGAVECLKCANTTTARAQYQEM